MAARRLTILGFMTTLLHHGMVIVGLPYAFQGQMGVEEIKGGSPYGASTITGGDGSAAALGDRARRRPRYQGAYARRPHRGQLSPATA